MSRVRLVPVAGVVGAVVCAALVAGAVSPAVAGEGDGAPGSGSGAAIVGAFGIGDGLEASVDEQSGAWRLALSVGTLPLTWDSQAMGEDPNGFGDGWSVGVARVATKGGVRVFPASGGVYELNAAEPSGLSGYGLEDLRFEVREGELPGRGLPAFEGSGGAERATVPYRYVLRELGGSVTYFDEHGNPVVREFPHDRRQDWVWDAERPGRLTATIDADGVVDVLDWDPRGGSVLVRPAANLPAEPDPVTGERPAPPAPWRVTIGRNGLSAIEDSTGGMVSVRYAPDSKFVTEVQGASGASTEVEWLTHTDGVTRVRHVRTVDAAGAELSKREWTPSGGTATGWPAQGSGAALPSDPGYRYRTELTDGKTRVVSEYNALHVLVGREMVATGPSGEFTLQVQSFEYPWSSDASLPAPDEVRGAWSKPTATEVTFRDAAGAERTSVEEYEFDAFGRPVSMTASDGTVTSTRYDEQPGEPGRPPMGLLTEETVIAPDGLVSITKHTLNEARTAAVASETFTGTNPDQLKHPEQLVSTGRVEVDLDDRGQVLEQRAFPVGESADDGPVVTRWQYAVDLAAGTRTTTETVGAGTSVEASVSETNSLRHGQVLEQVDPLGNVSRSGYDALGRPVIEVDASGRASERRYERAADDGRNATTTVGPDGVEVTQVVDALGRVIQTHDNLDRGTAKPGFVHIVERREYPDPGTVRVTDAWGATTETRQDVFGRPIETLLPSGLVQLAVHDDVANTVTTALTATGSLADAELVSTRTNDAAGREISTTTSRKDGAETPASTTEYDGLGRETRTGDGTLDVQLGYDAYGNPEQTTYAPATAAGLPGASITATRRFDGYGASLGKTVTGAEGTSTGGQREFDELGRPFHGIDGTTYGYDAENRPVTQTRADGSTVAIDYWADRTRRSVDGTGTRTEFYWDGAALLNDTHTAADEEGTGNAAYLLADGRQARSTSSTGGTDTSYYGNDRHGNVVDTTDPTGSVQSRTTYTDYGTPTTTYADGAEPTAELTRNPIGHAGSYENRDGTQHLDIRTYDTVTMRFGQLDPAGLFNDFAFGDLNPITNIDPTGRTAESDRWLEGGMAILLTIVAAVATVATGGGAVVMAGLAVTGAFEVGVVTAQVVNEAVGFMDDSTSTLLGHIALGVSIVAGVAAGAVAAYRAAGRIDDLTAGTMNLFGGIDGARSMTAAAPKPVAAVAKPRGPLVNTLIDERKIREFDRVLARQKNKYADNINHFKNLASETRETGSTRAAAITNWAGSSIKYGKFLEGRWMFGGLVRKGMNIWGWLGSGLGLPRLPRDMVRKIAGHYLTHSRTGDVLDPFFSVADEYRAATAEYNALVPVARQGAHEALTKTHQALKSDVPTVKTLLSLRTRTAGF